MADIWNIGGALLGGLLSSGDSTKTATDTKAPYAPAQPWINSNIASGQSLQSQYQAQPLSMGQIQAYGNSLGLSDGFRRQAGDLTQQMNSMKQFDRNDPTAKPTQFNFSSAAPDVNTVNQSLMASLPSASIGNLAQKASASNYGGLLGNSSSPSSFHPAATNLTDQQWADVKAMRDDVGWNNPFDRAGLEGFMAALGGSPMMAYNIVQNQIPYLNNYTAMRNASNAQAADTAAVNAMNSNGTSSSSGNSGWSSMGGLSLGDSNRSAIAAANGYGGGV